MVKSSYLFTGLAEARLPVESCDSNGQITYTRELTAEEDSLAAAILAEQEALFASPPVLAGTPVFGPDEIDLVTIRRIRALVCPDTADERLQAATEIRQVKNALADALVVIDHLTDYLVSKGMVLSPPIQSAITALNQVKLQNQIVDAIYAEGRALKTAQGWK